MSRLNSSLQRSLVYIVCRHVPHIVMKREETPKTCNVLANFSYIMVHLRLGLDAPSSPRIWAGTNGALGHTAWAVFHRLVVGLYFLDLNSSWDNQARI